MTGVETTYQTLTANPFKVGANNSSKIFAVVSIRDKFYRVFVPVYLQLLVVTMKLKGVVYYLYKKL